MNVLVWRSSSSEKTWSAVIAGARKRSPTSRNASRALDWCACAIRKPAYEFSYHIYRELETEDGAGEKTPTVPSRRRK